MFNKNAINTFHINGISSLNNLGINIFIFSSEILFFRQLSGFIETRIALFSLLVCVLCSYSHKFDFLFHMTDRKPGKDTIRL